MTFQQQIDQLRKTAGQLSDDHSDAHIEQVATRLEGLHFSPPVITPVTTLLRLRRASLLAEIDRILALEDSEACGLGLDDSRKCEDLRVQFITVLIFYYKKVVELRKGNPDEWDEVDELYVHD